SDRNGLTVAGTREKQRRTKAGAPSGIARREMLLSSGPLHNESPCQGASVPTKVRSLVLIVAAVGVMSAAAALQKPPAEVPAELITHRYAKFPVHMNGVNLRTLIKPVDGKDVAETIRVNHRLVAEQRQKTGQRMFAFLNHPNFGWGVRAEDLLQIDELRFFE